MMLRARRIVPGEVFYLYERFTLGGVSVWQVAVESKHKTRHMTKREIMAHDPEQIIETDCPSEP